MIRTITQPLKIVDDFLEAPFIWRDFALKQEFIKDQSGHPGVKSKTLDELNANIFHSFASNVIKHVSGKRSFERLKVNFVSSLDSDNINELAPHQDEHFYNVAGVVNLNEFAAPGTGTSFYHPMPEGFIKTTTVENMFNRLVIFHPSLWHAPDRHFGTSLENSRLTITLFGIAV
jgi:hypothetical protein